MNRLSSIAIILSALAVILPSAGAAYGYGTSTISTTPSSVSIMAAHSANVNYTVNLASGNTWGTTLSVVNNNQLSAQGITTSISNPSGNPPFSGTLTLTASQATLSGTYQVVLAATGDDPSTSNATVMLTVPAPASTSTVPAGGSGSSAPTTTAPTTSVPATVATTSINYYGGTNHPTPYSLGNYTLLIISIVIFVIIGGILMAMMKPMPTKLIILGVILILIGIAVWLYGDYHGGLMSYIWGGVGLIVVGTIVWLAGDAIAGAFMRKK